MIDLDAVIVSLFGCFGIVSGAFGVQIALSHFRTLRDYEKEINTLVREAEACGSYAAIAGHIAEGEEFMPKVTLADNERFEALLAKIRQLQPPTEDAKTAQRIDWVYGNLALTRNGADRMAFKKLATETLGWTEEKFDAWSFGRKWGPP